MSGTLDAALKTLRWEREWIESEADAAQTKAAIRILEAAGKVDKNDAISTWYWLHSESAIMPPYVPDGSRQIRALLDALPDEVKHE